MKWYRYKCPNCQTIDSNLHKRKSLNVYCSNCDSNVKLIEL